MRNPGTFWGIVLILVGLFLMLGRIGLMTPAILRVLAPLALVGLGVWLLWAAMRRPSSTVPQPQALAFQLKGADEATLKIRFGGGRLSVSSGAAPEELLSGRFSAGVEQSSRTEDEHARVSLSTPPSIALPFGIRGDHDWDIRLNESLPLRLDVDLGGGVASFDLAAIQLKSARIEVAGGRVEMIPPQAAGDVSMSIRLAAGEVVVTIPQDVAASVHTDALVGSVSVDTARFPKGKDGYRSPDYETAAHRVDLHLETIAGSITIH